MVTRRTDVVRTKAQTTAKAAPRAVASGHMPTLMIAAVDSTDADKAMADYVCTGINDEVKFNEALRALPAQTETYDGNVLYFGSPNPYAHYTSKGSGRLVVAAGVYRIRDSIVLDPNTALVGMGGASVIQVAPDPGQSDTAHFGAGDGPASTAFAMVRMTATHPRQQHVTISDLTFDGNDYNFSDTAHRITGIRLSGEFSTVERCHFYQISFRAIDFADGDYHKVINNSFVSCSTWREGRPDDNLSTTANGDIRAVIGGTPVYSHITGNKFLYNDFDSIYLQGAVFSVVNDNEMSDAAYHLRSSAITVVSGRGIAIVGNEANLGWVFVTIKGGSDYINVTANNVSAGASGSNFGEIFATIRLLGDTTSGQYGLKPLRNCSIQSNNMEGGIMLSGTGAYDNLIDGNLINWNNNGSYPNRSGITLLDNTSRNKITNNMIRKPVPTSQLSEYGIFIAAGCTANWVAMNDVYGAWSIAAIQDNGTLTDVTPYNRV